MAQSISGYISNLKSNMNTAYVSTNPGDTTTYYSHYSNTKSTTSSSEYLHDQKATIASAVKSNTNKSSSLYTYERKALTYYKSWLTAYNNGTSLQLPNPSARYLWSAGRAIYLDSLSS